MLRIIPLIVLIFFVSCMPMMAFDSQSTAFSVGVESKSVKNIAEVGVINKLLDKLEEDWNNHNSKQLAKYFADDFVNGDGLDLASVKELTAELWEAYPDIKTQSLERNIRVQGDYATVQSTDVFEGTSSMIRDEVGSHGILKAVSMGELFLKKFGPKWKITSDRTFYEKVSIGYALGSDLVDDSKIRLITPEQAVGGHEYTARLEFDLPPNIKPVAAISKEVLVYPQLPAEDKFRLVNEPKLERLLWANKNSRNELITATVGLTGGALQPKLLGLVFFSKRVNVVPVSHDLDGLNLVKTPARSALDKSVAPIDFHDVKIEEKIDDEKKQENNKDAKDNSESKE